MSQTEQILDVFVETQGWSKNTIIDLCLTYIENQDSPEAWKDYLESLAEVDDDIAVETPDNWDERRMVFVCERHGGTWGEDETCGRCTYADGTVRPQTDKGPLGPGGSVMIAIHTNAPIMPLTQMIGDDAVIGFPFEVSDVLTVLTEDEVLAHFIAKTLDILGYQTEVVTQTEV